MTLLNKFTNFRFLTYSIKYLCYTQQSIYNKIPLIIIVLYYYITPPSNHWLISIPLPLFKQKIS